MTLIPSFRLIIQVSPGGTPPKFWDVRIIGNPKIPEMIPIMAERKPGRIGKSGSLVPIMASFVSRYFNSIKFRRKIGNIKEVLGIDHDLKNGYGTHKSFLNPFGFSEQVSLCQMLHHMTKKRCWISMYDSNFVQNVDSAFVLGAISDEDGSYYFSYPPEGDYRISVSKLGYETMW